MEKNIRYLRYLIPALVIICICCFVFCYYFKTPVTTVILVRHADRTGSIDQLNADGIARAQELARVLDVAGITNIYASTYNRTQQTASPLATQLGITVVTYDAGNLPDLVNDIKSNHKGEVTLVVGHSNTVLPTIGLLGITPVPPDIPEYEFDHLYIVTFGKQVTTRMIKMEYGADTP